MNNISIYSSIFEDLSCLFLGGAILVNYENKLFLNKVSFIDNRGIYGSSIFLNRNNKF